MKKYDNGSVRYVLFKSGYFFGEDDEQWCDRRKIMSVDEYCDRDGDYEEGACVDWLIKGYKERGLEMHYIEKQMFDRVRGSFGYWDVDEFYGENGRKWYYDFVIDVEEEDVLLLKYVGEDAWNEMKKGEFVWARRNEDKDEGGWIVRGYS